jgi:hypothetical protein
MQPFETRFASVQPEEGIMLRIRELVQNGRYLTLPLVAAVALCAIPGIEAKAPQKNSVALPGDKYEPVANVPPGVLGMPAVMATPRNLGKHTPADLENSFKMVRDCGGGVQMITEWSNKDMLPWIGYVLSQARKHSMTPVIGLSPTSLDHARKELVMPRSLRGKRSFADKDVKAEFVKSALSLAQLGTPYLCLATEINFLAQRPDEYKHFVAAYKDAYRAVKQAFPNTKVFVSFQYDWVRTLDHRQPDKFQEHFNLIDVFRPELDLVAITSYPAQFFKTPAEMPSNYYSYFRKYLKPGEEVMVMEIGWPSSGYGNEDTQQQFIRRLPELLSELSPSVTVWSLLHDVTHLSNTKNPVGTVGLLTQEGKPKPALTAWREVAGAPRK